MKKLIAGTFLLFFYVTATAQSTYNSYDLFAPSTYPYGANMIRNGAGEPGPAYWQNRADYKISTSLDESKNEVKGSVVMTYLRISLSVFACDVVALCAVFIFSVYVQESGSPYLCIW